MNFIVKAITSVGVFLGSMFTNGVNYEALNHYSTYLPCYQGWSQTEARNDFEKTFKGDIKKLYASKDCDFITPTSITTPTPTKKVVKSTPAQAPIRNDGSRTGRIIPYKTWCEFKDVMIYENEIVPYRASDGKTYNVTKNDAKCVERQVGKSNTNTNSLITYDCVIKGKTYPMRHYTTQKAIEACDYNKRMIDSLDAQAKQWEIQDALTQQELKAKLNEITSRTYVAPVDNTAENELKAKCNQSVQEWNSYLEDFYANYADDFASSAESAKFIIGKRDEFQSELRGYGCNVYLRVM